MHRYILITLTAALAVPGAFAQGQTAPKSAATQSSGVIRGSVKDDTGGVIPGATVTLSNQKGTVATTTTGVDGTYTFRHVTPGNYIVTPGYSGLSPIKAPNVAVQAGQPVVANLTMTVRAKQQEITVTEAAGENQISTEASNNASALVLKKEDLDALPDDPDDLQADLEALAGPAAGPGGTQIFIDGFSGGRLPPKESIREIRINSNPFSAEFDKLGYGRIQIFTKPGSDKFHGQAYYTISDNIWNSRNPFLDYNPYFRTQLFGGNVSGPLSKKASFFVDFERRDIDDNGVVTATVPYPSLSGYQSLQEAVATPQRRTTVSPRVDYQLNSNNTLSVRYAYLDNSHLLTHVGGFDVPNLQVQDFTLPSNGYSQDVTDQSVQVVETAVLSPHTINETHFEFEQTNQYTTSLSTAPELNVGQSFISGGSGFSSTGFPKSYDKESYNEIQNYTTINWGAHTTKFGFRIRSSQLADVTPTDFNGEYTFLGNGTQELSIDQYLQTERLLAQGDTPAQIHALGYGPSKFTIETGNPNISFYQLDFGPFINDDWKVRPNLTVSLGLRWEAQTNIGDKNDWAPRIGIAWAPGSHGANSRPSFVIRAGAGYFYDRFPASDVLAAYRSSQVQQYTLYNPLSYDASFSAANLPPLSALTPTAAQSFIIDSNLKAPRLLQAVIGVDKQLAKRTTLSVNYVFSRGTHELLTDDINAPIPIVGDEPPGYTLSATGNTVASVVRPFSNLGDIYDYQSTGMFKQSQVHVSFNSQIGRWFTLFSHYTFSNAHSDTDGLGTMPANPYNIAANWGRSSLDIGHTFFLGGSFLAPMGLRFSPFVVMRTGTPYDITTGTDLYDTGAVAPTARPSYTDAATAGAILTPFGYLNPTPAVGAPIVERNLATGPSFIGVNLRVSKTWGFGTTSFKGNVGGTRAHQGGGWHGGGGGFGGDYTEHRYNLTLSVNARNILNHENLNTPNGALTSPYFMESTGITGGFGAESTASNQRRIELQLRFAF